MKNKFLILTSVIVLSLGVIASMSLFVVKETEQVLVLQFGKVVKVHLTPGLKTKWPFIQEISRYEKRLLGYILPVSEVTAGDQKRIILDLFVRYTINDALRFYKSVQNEKGVEARMSTIVAGSMKSVIGRVPLVDLLSNKRTVIMDAIQKQIEDSATKLGLNIIDVRIVRADLPKENSEAIFMRMESERNQEAQLYRYIGKRQATEIRSDARKQSRFLLADAQKVASQVMGRADATALNTYAKVYDGGDPMRRKFFDFYRSLQAMKEGLNPENTKYVLSPEKNAFFKFFQK